MSTEKNNEKEDRGHLYREWDAFSKWLSEQIAQGRDPLSVHEEDEEEEKDDGQKH